MCGIITYIGKKQALPILLNGLRRLEYRGYDSAGVAIYSDNEIKLVKSVGKIDNLASKTKDTSTLQGNVGIAHTRWATHGGVTEENTHPHRDCSGNIALVHNGIIENYRELKAELSDHHFSSETDTEVLAHLIEKNYAGNLREAIQKALVKVRGTYGLVVFDRREPDKIIVARLGSPIAIGIGEGEYYIASDTSPMLAYTKQVIFLDDGEMAEITREGAEVFTLHNQVRAKSPEHIEWNEAQAEKQGFPHFMLKEIFDQPTVIQDAMRGRINFEHGTAHLGGLKMSLEEMNSIGRIILVGCGTSSYAAMIGKVAFEQLAGIPTQVEIASEFRYSDPIIDEHTLVFALSQSGETADTLAAVREAQRKGARVRGIVNVVGSTIARETDGGTYIHAGPELAVASTKAYTNMVAVLILYALQFGRSRRVSLRQGQEVVQALQNIPEQMKKILEQSSKIQEIASVYQQSKNMVFLGRGIQFPVALEGALKLKEISYIHSEGLAGGEMKHGPIALLSPEFPVVGIMTQNHLYEKMRSNIEEVRARHAPIILIATEGDGEAQRLSEQVVYIPKTLELIEPFLTTIVLQLFAYHMAVILGRDVDRPRNLAKSVTVE
jgi:glucosamine--fructose-6-phosphate aminotransferase (isomerizing)